VCRVTARLKGKQVPRILVADDNSNIQKMVALAFAEHGIDVIAVGNGEAAVRRMPDLNPDVVLADVFMPVRNGYEVCEYIKKDPRFCKTPVILLVGAFDPLDEQEARRVGADGVLKKPFVPPDPLIAMVTAALEKAPKPEVKVAAPEPVAEIPKIVAPPPPPVVQAFPDPTPEEEAYMFGSGRRSLDDDEKIEAAAPRGVAVGAPTAVQTVETGLDTEATAEADAEDDAKFSGTRADWRRRDEVDFASVPSFATQLVDAPADAPVDARASASVAPGVKDLAEQLAEQRAETSTVTAAITSEVTAGLTSDVAPEASPTVASHAASVITSEAAPVVEADPFAYQQPEAEIRSVVATSSIESIAEAPAIEPEAPAREFELQRAPEVSAASPSPVIEPPAAEPEPAPVAHAETPVQVAEAAPVKLEEPPIRIEAPRAPEHAPILNSVVETVTSPRKWLDFLLPSRAPRPTPVAAEPVASVVEPAPIPEPPVMHAPVEAAPVAIEPSVSDSTITENSPAIAESHAEPSVETLSQPATVQEFAMPESSANAFESAPVASADEAASPAPVSEQPPIEDLRQHWSEIASQLAQEAPLVEAAQTAMNADRMESSEIAAPESETHAVQATESLASDVTAADSYAPASPVHAAEETAAPVAAAPTIESLAAAISSTTAQSAAPAASPNIDEVVAKILEKLGPQIQEMLAKGVVKPLVEDILKNSEERKK
jgi:CheY-like chemotaxis protein